MKNGIGTIRPCRDEDLGQIGNIINSAAKKYHGVIPPDRYHDPYLPHGVIRQEIAAGITFWGYEKNGKLCGVMGLQNVYDVTLLRHAYVLTEHQGQGVGSQLIEKCKTLTDSPILVGTWAAAHWAIAFYVKHGFQPVSQNEKDRLLTKYWAIPPRQVETSVVLADQAWFSQAKREKR